MSRVRRKPENSRFEFLGNSRIQILSKDSRILDKPRNRFSRSCIGSIASSISSAASSAGPKMVERFFSTSRPTQPEFFEPTMILLSGPPCCGKTSLLFQFAINRALESSSEVIFMCNERKLENKPPFLSQAVDPSSDVLERIHIKYVEDYEGIKKYFAAFHLHERFPSAVIIDDFGDFFRDVKCQQKYGNARARDLAMVRTLALCQDAVSHANGKLQPHQSCTILFSDLNQGDTPRLLFIYERWIKCFFTIRGDGLGSYILKKNSSISRGAKYSIALQYLVLEEIIEE